MKRPSKLTPREQEQQAAAQQQVEQAGSREFATAEEMLRHDALHTPVPPGIARRLRDSVANLPQKSWWQRLFRS